MNNKKNYLNLGINFLLFSLFSILIINNIFFENYNVLSNKITAIVVLVFSIYLVYLYRQSTSLFILMFFIAYINYSIAIGVYLIPNTPNILYSQIPDTKTLGIGIFTILIFTALLVFFAPSRIDKVIDFQYTQNAKRRNLFIVSIIIITLGFIGVYGYDANIGTNSRGTSSPLYEYSTIFFILGFHFAANSRKAKFLLSVIVFMFMLQSFISGNRVEAISFGIAYFIYYWSHRVGYKKVLPALFTGIILMAFIGQYRQDFSITDENFFNFITLLGEKAFAFDTAIWAYFPSLSIIKVTNEMLVPTNEKIYLFVQSILYIFVGGSVPDNNIASYMRHFYYHAYGSVSPAYYFFWFRWAGVLLYFFIVQIYVKFTLRRNDKYGYYKSLLSLYIIATVPRWYLFGPNPMFRGVFLFTVVYLIFYFLDCLLKKGKIDTKTLK